MMLITMASTLCGMFLSQNNGLFYQAEERGNVTIEWHFALKTGIKVSSLKIHCVQLPELKVFYHLDNSFIEAQHEQFAGRVQCDKEALKAGWVRLHLARVRTEDSAGYLCRMATGCGRKVKEFTLNITSPEESVVLKEQPEPVTRGRTSLFIVLGLFTVASALLASCASFTKHHTPGCLR
ncbi:hypothetical protein AMECASPLE_005511 [Ameca splendens]|uniref:Immunoglobulin V-set domain-containing protein n=1 Tax=Ameca splendens TaxID=208324 RepID=A0ABV0ZV31_9TELE